MPTGIYLRTEDHKQKISQSLLGHEVSSKTRKKMSNSRQGKRSNFYGKHHSKETKQKLRKPKPSMKGENNPAKRPEVRKKIGQSNFGKKRSSETKEKIRQARLHQILPTKDTSIEKIIQEILKNRNIIFQTHKPIKGQPDVFIEPNVCIFCDGDYWHNRPEQKERDKRVNKYLIRDGYVILRFWEYEIRKNSGECVNKIEKTIK